MSKALRVIERVLLPATTPADHASPDDYRGVVLLIALLAVGFFPGSLVLASVPMDLWLPFTCLSAVAAVVISAPFVLLRRNSPLVLPAVVASAVTVAILGLALRPYYHQIDLLYALFVSAHAIVHGFRPAIVVATLGSVIVPYALQEAGAANSTDPVYALIYLSGVAAIPSVAGRLASRRLGDARRNLRAVQATERAAVRMLARASEAKDDVTGDHVLRVGELAARVAAAAGHPEHFVDGLRDAAMLHDVGKLHVPDHILTKPGPLDATEWSIVRNHTLWGERILEGAAGFELARRVARSHHENWDGSGYPDGLAGLAIPLEARIVRVVDVFDALRTERSYKTAWSLDQCVDELHLASGKLFDPEIVAVFLELLEAGGLVQAFTIRAGVGRDMPSIPTARTLLATPGAGPLEPAHRGLSR